MRTTLRPLITCSTLALCASTPGWAETDPAPSNTLPMSAPVPNEQNDLKKHTNNTKKKRPPTHKPKQELIHVYGNGHISYGAEESSIGDKTGMSFLQQTQTANVVTHQTIKDMAPQTMEDIAKYVPGITIGNSFGGTQDSLLKRGFGGPDDGSILRDGVRMPIGRNFTTATTERVEVLKGPASLFYGMQEPGGVINIITKQPRKDWAASFNSSWASLGGGSGTLDVGGPLTANKELTFRLIGNFKNENYWRNFGANKDKIVAPSLRYEHKRLKLDLSYQWEDYHNVLDRGAFFYNGKPISGRKYRLDEHWTADYGTRHLLAGAAEYRLTQHDRIRLTSGWNADRYHDRQADPRDYNPTTGILRRRFRSNTGTTRANSYVALDVISEHRLLGMTHKIAIGGDYENRRITQGSFLTGSTYGGFRPSDPVYGQLPMKGVDDKSLGYYHTRINSASFYVKDNIHIGHGITISPGVRYQWFHYSYGGGEPFVKATDSSYAKPLPFIGVVYQPNKHVSFFWDYSQSYNPNQISPGTVLTSGYKPTSGRQFEVGARYQKGFLTADVALYNIHKKNIQQTDGQTETGALRQRLSGLAGSKGVEAEINGRLTRHWNIITNYAYTYARTMKDIPATQGKLLTNVARHTGGGYLTYQTNLPWHQSSLRFGAGARYVGRRPGDARNSFWLPGYATVDLFAAWKIRKVYGHTASVQLNADNIANKAYFISSSGANTRVSWGQGRTIRVSIGVSL